MRDEGEIERERERAVLTFTTQNNHRVVIIVLDCALGGNVWGRNHGVAGERKFHSRLE